MERISVVGLGLRRASSLRIKPSVSFVLLILFLCVVWIAGGASQADVWGQIAVRVTAWTCLFIAIIFSDRLSLKDAKPVVLLLVASFGLILLQLIPLPASIWQSLSGRRMLWEAATASGQPQPWRPYSIVPSATVNAASSFVIPFVTLMLFNGLKKQEKLWIPGLVLCLIFMSTLLGVVQFSGLNVYNPLINGAGQVSGNFANRNHFALLLALGCMLAPTWAFLGERRSQLHSFVALGLVILFFLIILASGSRAGMVVGILALSIDILLVGKSVKRRFGHYPRWVFFSVIAMTIAVIALFVIIGIKAGRAVSVERAFALAPDQDLRDMALPTVLKMIWEYFPFGAGIGSFDPIFRIHEPFDFLSPVYFNHAHNDFLEIALDAGLPGISLLFCALGWWAIASIRVWRSASGGEINLSRLGSAMLLLVMIASVLDYPVRTPIMMVVVVISSMWLSEGIGSHRRAALPGSGLAL